MELILYIVVGSILGTILVGTYLGVVAAIAITVCKALLKNR